MITFSIPTAPQGKARARIFKVNGSTRAVTPEKTVNYENLIRFQCIEANKEKIFYEKEPLKVVIEAYFDIPKSTSKKNRALMMDDEIYPTKKPDADNISKVVLDALNGICYKDDTQVVKLLVIKKYDSVSCVHVTIASLEEEY